MSPVDRDLLYVQHIEDRIARIEGIAAQGRDAFNASYILQDAVIRSFEVIGEAVKNLSADRTARYSDSPWRRVAGFRDILIHNYMGVDLDEVWNVIDNELSRLKETIRVMRQEIENA